MHHSITLTFMIRPSLYRNFMCEHACSKDRAKSALHLLISRAKRIATGYMTTEYSLAVIALFFVTYSPPCGALQGTKISITKATKIMILML